jgi:hypothetical protein
MPSAAKIPERGLSSSLNTSHTRGSTSGLVMAALIREYELILSPETSLGVPGNNLIFYSIK